MNRVDKRRLSEEEADAEIERVQQKITLALQQIDENFATCNQIVTSRIGPGIDQYGEASQQVWDFSKTWLYFFNAMNTETPAYSVQDDDSEYSTNRPAFDESSIGSSYRMNHHITANDITNLTGRPGLIRTRLRQSASSINSTNENNPLRPTYTPARSTVSMSSGSSASHRNDMSPPRTIPFELPSGSLQGTPIREQAKVLTEHTLRQVGIHSSESESSGARPTPTPAAPKDKESYGRAWGESNMDTDDPESRAKFNEFLQKRSYRLEEMAEGEELQTIRAPVKSPSNRTPIFQQREQESVLVSTPTIERVMAMKQTDLRQIQTPIRRDRELSDFEPETSTPVRGSLNDEDVGAFEFSDNLPDGLQQRNSLFGTPSSTKTGESDITMMQGQYTSMVPAHFDVHYFPEKFRTPPSSVMLTRVYHEYNDRPGTMLTVKDIMQHINDPTYTEKHVSILVSLLTRKKYLKKVGNHDAWVIRR
ncbi:unnamed protein product [Mucor hiemalis]